MLGFRPISTTQLLKRKKSPQQWGKSDTFRLRVAKTEVITLTNQKGHRLVNQSKLEENTYSRREAWENVRKIHDWFLFYFQWLVEKVMRFLVNQQA